MESPSNVGPNIVRQILCRERISNEIGFRRNLHRERLEVAKDLYRTDLVGHYGCVNAIEFSNYGCEFLASGGDDRRVLIWNVEKSSAGLEAPRVLDTEHQSNIFCFSFDKHNRRLLSGGNDELVLLHDFETGKLLNLFKHDKAVLGLSFDLTSNNLFASACENGQTGVFDLRQDPADPIIIARQRGSFQAVKFYPADGNFLLTANSKKGAALWDMRQVQSPLLKYGSEGGFMSISFNTNGSLIAAIRRRLPPIMFNTFDPKPICQFYHPDYFNSCTMKSCCFAGPDDEYILSGSDDFNLYVWRVNDADLHESDQWIESTKMVLYGHRSIVNQVRYNPDRCMIASSGVEKIIKLWSPFSQRDWTGSLTEETNPQENAREVVSRETFATMIQANNSHLAQNSFSTNEDMYMMAFFDSLVQQELEAWDSNYSSDDSVESSLNTTHKSSIEDSDEEELVRYLAPRERHRRHSASMKLIQRNKYPNRIAFLIATKRNTLRRLALRGTSHSARRNLNCTKSMRANSHRTALGRSPQSQSRHGSKRNGRHNSIFRRGSITKNGNRSKRRYKPVADGFRTLRKKTRMRSIPELSSDDCSNESTDSDENTADYSTNSVNSTNIAIPSTSTGITSSGKEAMIKLRQQQLEYSDDDDDEDSIVTHRERQSINVSDPPVNGLHSAAGTRHIRHTSGMDSRANSNRKRRSDLNICTSSSISCVEDEDDSSSNETPKRKKQTGANPENNTSNMTDFIGTNHISTSTPNTMQISKTNEAGPQMTPDSGVSTNTGTPSCSRSLDSLSGVGNSSQGFDKEPLSNKKHIYKHPYQRRTYRKNFDDDSDSD